MAEEDPHTVDPIAEEDPHTADPEQPAEGFAEGQADEALHEHIGRFSEGQEELGELDPEKHHRGRFSEGQELLGEEDPEKHLQGRYSEGQDYEGPPGGLAPNEGDV